MVHLTNVFQFSSSKRNLIFPQIYIRIHYDLCYLYQAYMVL